MKQKTMYIILAIFLIAIIILLTILVTSVFNQRTSRNSASNLLSTKVYSNYPIRNLNLPVYGDIDYAYDYDGYWFQPSRWWNNLWNRRHNSYDRRYNYDRHDGLDMHNRYINNSIHINPHTPHSPHNLQPPHTPHSPHNLQPPHSPHNLQPQPPQQPPPQNPSIISLVKPNPESFFPLPTLSSSSSLPIMPEEIAMSPMSSMHPSLNHHTESMQDISTFVSNLPSEFKSNFNYKGPDEKNHKPFPVDMMASESIYLQPKTVANEIIKPPIVMEHPNPM